MQQDLMRTKIQNRTNKNPPLPPHTCTLSSSWLWFAWQSELETLSAFLEKYIREFLKTSTTHRYGFSSSFNSHLIKSKTKPRALIPKWRLVLWIRFWIRIDLTIQDPDPNWECGSGSESGGMGNDQNEQINQLSSIFFKKKLKLFVTLKFDQDLDPHESALVLLPDPDPDPNRHFLR